MVITEAQPGASRKTRTLDTARQVAIALMLLLFVLLVLSRAFG